MTLLTGTMKNRRSGFTLLEIMLVAIILTLLISITVPNFKKTYENMELDNAVRNISQLMKYIQEKGVLGGISYRILFLENKYWIEKQGKGATYFRLRDKIGKTYFLPKDVSIDPREINIHFFPDGDIEEAELIISKKNIKRYKITTKELKGHFACKNLS
ncbi:Tfp pilus assembly protein FimT/FimU [Candidatus Auribacterota bacterium]